MNLQRFSLKPFPVFPRRRDRLWEETCLELFLGEEGSERYWEFNLSPAGHWNVYRFEFYVSDKGSLSEPFSTPVFSGKASPLRVMPLWALE